MCETWWRLVALRLFRPHKNSRHLKDSLPLLAIDATVKEFNIQIYQTDPESDGKLALNASLERNKLAFW